MITTDHRDIPRPIEREGHAAVPLSVVVAARNEANNIRECIRSVAWADQVFVLDSQSTDLTVEVSESEGALVEQFHYNGGWPKKRNWALHNLPIRNDWVLVLDADERVTDELRCQIRLAVQQNEYDGFYLKWKFMFLNRWMKHSWSHGWMVRLFRYGKAEYEDLGMRGQGGWDAEVHENIVVNGPCGKLSGYLLHESHDDLAFWIRKQNEFSTWNATRRADQLTEPFPPLSCLFSRDPGKQRKWLKALFIRFPAGPTLLFLWLYLIRLGCLDGKSGFYFCRLRAMHELTTRAKLYEMSIQRAAEGSEEAAESPEQSSELEDVGSV